MSDKPSAPQAQASPQNIVTDFKTREQWKRAFDAVALPWKYKPRACILISRLADHFNCKTGQCNPGFDTLAKEMRCSEKTVGRAVSDVEPDGWLHHKRGGDGDKGSFTLCVPAAIRPDSMVSTLKTISDQTPNAIRPDTQCVRTYEQTNRQERSALKARASSASVLADTVGDHLKHEPCPFRESAPDGALDDIDEEFNNRARASLARNPTWTVHASS